MRIVYRLIDAGDLTRVPIGRVIRRRQSELNEYLERNQIQPGELRHLHSEDEKRED